MRQVYSVDQKFTPHFAEIVVESKALRWLHHKTVVSGKQGHAQ